MATPLRIFVSHSHEDADWCTAFVSAMRRYNADVWYDEDRLRIGRLRRTIEAELEQRPIFIVVYSPASVESNWVDREVDAALNFLDEEQRAHPGRPPERVIVPVVAVKCKVPVLLRSFKRISGPGDAGLEPQEAAERVAQALDLALVPASPSTSVATDTHRPADAGAVPIADVATAGATPRGVSRDDAGVLSADEAAHEPIVDKPADLPAGDGKLAEGESVAPAPQMPGQASQPYDIDAVLGSRRFTHAITDLYDEQRRTVLVQVPITTLIVVIVLGLVAFAITGFVGYRDPLEGGVTHALFREPWPLYLWLCMLVVLLQTMILRSQILRPQLVATFIVDVLAIFFVGVPYYYASQLTQLLPTFLAAPLASLAARVADPRNYAVINGAVLLLYVLTTLPRWLRRLRGMPAGKSALVSLDDGGEAAPPALPTLQQLVTGDLIGAGIFSLALYGFFRSSVLSALSGTIPVGGALTGAASAQLASVESLDVVIAACCFGEGVLLLVLTALDRSLAAGNRDRGQLGFELRTILRLLRGRFFDPLVRRVALAVRSIAWPILILLGMIGLAAASRYIQNYLHLLSDQRTCVSVATCGDLPTFQSVQIALAQHQQYQALGLALVWGIVAVLCVVFAAALLLFRWRVAENTLRFLGLVGFIVLLTFWVFSLALSGVNAAFSLINFSHRVPFPQPGASTVISFASLVLWVLSMLIRRLRGRRQSDRPPAYNI